MDRWQEYDCPAGADADLHDADRVRPGQSFPCSWCGAQHVATADLVTEYAQPKGGELRVVPLGSWITGNELAPLPKERRHLSDYRSEQEHEDVCAVLRELPPDHPAVLAYTSGAREGADTAVLSHQLKERMDLVERLVDAIKAAIARGPVGILDTPAGRK